MGIFVIWSYPVPSLQFESSIVYMKVLDRLFGLFNSPSTGMELHIREGVEKHDIHINTFLYHAYRIHPNTYIMFGNSKVIRMDGKYIKIS